MKWYFQQYWMVVCVALITTWVRCECSRGKRFPSRKSGTWTACVRRHLFESHHKGHFMNNQYAFSALLSRHKRLREHWSQRAPPPPKGKYIVNYNKWVILLLCLRKVIWDLLSILFSSPLGFFAGGCKQRANYAPLQCSTVSESLDFKGWEYEKRKPIADENNAAGKEVKPLQPLAPRRTNFFRCRRHRHRRRSQVSSVTSHFWVKSGAAVSRARWVPPLSEHRCTCAPRRLWSAASSALLFLY